MTKNKSKEKKYQNRMTEDGIKKSFDVVPSTLELIRVGSRARSWRGNRTETATVRVKRGSPLRKRNKNNNTCSLIVIEVGEIKTQGEKEREREKPGKEREVRGEDEI